MTIFAVGLCALRWWPPCRCAHRGRAGSGRGWAGRPWRKRRPRAWRGPAPAATRSASRPVGMRHGVLRAHIPAFHRPFDEVDARGEDQLVVRQRGAAGEAHGPGGAVHADRPVMHDIDAAGAGEPAVSVPDIGDFLEAADIEVREEAAVVGARRLHQRDLDGALAVLRDIARRRGAAGAAADHDHARAALADGCRGCQQAGRRFAAGRADERSPVEFHGGFLLRGCVAVMAGGARPHSAGLAK